MTRNGARGRPRGRRVAAQAAPFLLLAAVLVLVVPIRDGAHARRDGT